MSVLDQKCFIFRNSTIEYLFKDKPQVMYSNYSCSDSVPSDYDNVIFLKFIPIQFELDRLLLEIQDYFIQIQQVVYKNPLKKIYVVSLYNYFYESVDHSSNEFSKAISEFNDSLYHLGNHVHVIAFESLVRNHKIEDLIDMKYYYAYGCLINPKIKKHFIAWLVSELEKFQRPRRKCLVLDLDNTLWGGVLGEDGIPQLHISGAYPGNVYNDFQKLILSFKNSGIILCLASKNNLSDVEACFKLREDMVLKWEDFLVHKVSWQRKDSSLMEIASDLGIGLESLVFVDDSPIERELVKKALPEVCVLDFPSEVYELPIHFLRAFNLEFGTNGVTQSDRLKTNEYKMKLEADDVKNRGLDEEAFIKELRMVLSYQKINDLNRTRLVQLINKTNQFNLTTRRYNDTEILQMEDGGLITVLHLEDKFGNHGLVAAGIVKILANKAIIDTFTLSCRIIGRKIENEYVKLLLNNLSDIGITEVEAEYIKTSKNSLVESFYESVGFTLTHQDEERKVYHIHLVAKFELCPHYKVKYDLGDFKHERKST